MNFELNAAGECRAVVTPGDEGASGDYDLGLFRKAAQPTPTPDQAIYFVLEVDASGGSKTVQINFSTFQTGAIPAGVGVNGTPNASGAATDADGAAMALARVQVLRLVAVQVQSGGQVQVGVSASGGWSAPPLTEWQTGSSGGGGTLQLEGEGNGWPVTSGAGNLDVTVTDGEWEIRVMVVGCTS